MGTDIHIYLATKEKGKVTENLFDGRNSEWFDNMQGRGSCDKEHDILMNYCDYHWEKVGINDENEDNFGHYLISVKDYFNWYQKYKPYLDAGWTRKYDAWCYRHKGIIPELIEHRLPAYPTEDVEWIEVDNEYCCDTIIYEKIQDYLTENIYTDAYCIQQIPADLYLIWCFDN